MPATIKVKGALEEITRVKKLFETTQKQKIGQSVTNMAADMKAATPIDTGLARSSWRIVETGNKDIPYKVENLVPYIEFLNAGSSKQAPPYFIEKIALSYGKPVGAVVQIKESPEVL